MKRVLFAILIVSMVIAVSGIVKLILEHRASGQLRDVVVEVSFNRPASGQSEILDDLLQMINEAESNIDIALYHISNSDVLSALSNACSREISISLVTEWSDGTESAIPGCVDVRYEKNERLMHHKFMIVDETKVWTSSANWTDTSFFVDTNNSVLLHGPEIANVYQIEFDEMFQRARYGREKRDRNMDRIRGQNIEIEVYFSPSDRVRDRLIELIEAAVSSIDLAVYAMTDNAIYESLRVAQARGVQIRAVWDFLSQSGCAYSEVDEWTKSGIGVVESMPGLLHHKFAVFDDEIVVTGSANWSASGFDWNDENLLIIHSGKLVHLYKQEFDRLLQDAMAFVKDPSRPPSFESRHFEWVPGAVLLQWSPHDTGVVEAYELCRLTRPDASSCEKRWTLPSHSWYFKDDDVIEKTQSHYKIRTIYNDGFSEYSSVHPASVQSVDVQHRLGLSLNQVHDQFEQFKGDAVTVEFEVYEVFVSNAGNLFLNSGEDHTSDFTVFIHGCSLERFTGSGLDLFSLTGKTIVVTGELIEFNGPEIIVTSPWQVALLENQE